MAHNARVLDYSTWWHPLYKICSVGSTGNEVAIDHRQLGAIDTIKLSLVTDSAWVLPWRVDISVSRNTRGVIKGMYDLHWLTENTDLPDIVTLN